jgi:hypothetical protein
VNFTIKVIAGYSLQAKQADCVKLKNSKIGESGVAPLSNIALLPTYTSFIIKQIPRPCSRTSPAPLAILQPQNPISYEVVSDSFSDAGAAIEAVFSAANDPVNIIVFGEYHPVESVGREVPTTYAHFKNEVLPKLKGRTAALQLETLQDTCPTNALAQKINTELGRPSQQLIDTEAAFSAAITYNIVPNYLPVSCGDQATFTLPGGGYNYPALRTWITSRLVDQISRQRATSSQPLVIYGGSLHADPQPPEEEQRQAWSIIYQAQATYLYPIFRSITIDLLVPELVEADINSDSPDMPERTFFYRQWLSGLPSHSVRLIKVEDNNPLNEHYVIIFPRTPSL